ncbi:MAG: toll/interleukin-1 receptor domain-containing protein [Rhodopirellula sp.]|nr:toll/interleukin-1 receptor domain-containing protein [Rhodopirellula sp.]
MANPEHVEMVKQGAKAIREWRAKNSDVRLDLSGADLRGADLGGLDLSGAYLREANLRGASLNGARLNGADLSRAILSRANLDEANLRGADLSRANVGWTTLRDVDLSATKGMETIRHDGPSTVEVGTLVKYQGRIPIEFLRGCGLASWEILEVELCYAALTGEQLADIAYKVHDLQDRDERYIGGVFISYSHDDAVFVDKVYQRLQYEGVSVWLDRHDMVARPLQEQVIEAIRLRDMVLLVLSEASVNSDWVENELDIAHDKEKKEKRDVLCPIALDECWKAKLDHGAPHQKLWRTLIHKNILDFSKWKTKAFDDQFSKLLRGLKIC